MAKCLHSLSGSINHGHPHHSWQFFFKTFVARQQQACIHACWTCVHVYAQRYIHLCIHNDNTIIDRHIIVVITWISTRTSCQMYFPLEHKLQKLCYSRLISRPLLVYSIWRNHWAQQLLGFSNLSNNILILLKIISWSLSPTTYYCIPFLGSVHSAQRHGTQMQDEVVHSSLHCQTGQCWLSEIGSCHLVMLWWHISHLEFF